MNRWFREVVVAALAVGAVSLVWIDLGIPAAGVGPTAVIAGAKPGGAGQPGDSGRRVAPPRYEDWFTGEAMRVDLFHGGDGAWDGYSLDEVAWEPVWPGTRRYLVDPFGYGTRRFRVTDAATGTEIFRQGYATLFDEWTGTDEALAGVVRTMSESVRLPWPVHPVVLHVDRRVDDGSFEEVFSITLDPASHQVVRTRPFAEAQIIDLTGGPEPRNALDVVIVPEGYSRKDVSKLRTDLVRFAGVLMGHEPFSSAKASIHVRGIEAFSKQSGVSEPRKGIWRDTLLAASFNTFDSPRYLTVQHTKVLRQVASAAPYDAILVMVNTGRYGGGGVYNQWAVFPSDNEYDDYVMIHEFGHSMAGLGDEYFDSAVSTDEDLMYPPGFEPWEPNITAMIGGGRQSVKWASLVDAATPVPTPPEPAFAGSVGAFEGAGYKAKGLWRPQLDCKMFHKGMVGFCSVCSLSIRAMIAYYAGGEVP